MATSYLDDESKLIEVVQNLQKEHEELKQEREQRELEEQSNKFLDTFLTKEDFETWTENFANAVGEKMQEGFVKGFEEFGGQIQKQEGKVSDKVTPNTQKQGSGSNNKLASDQNLDTAYDQKSDEKNSASGSGNDGSDETNIVLKEEDKKEDKKDDEEKDDSGKVRDIEDKIKTLQNERSSLMQKMVGSGSTPADEATESEQEDKDEKKKEEGRQTVAVGQDPLLTKEQTPTPGQRNILLEAAQQFTNPMAPSTDEDDIGMVVQGSSVFGDGATLMKELHRVSTTESDDVIGDAARFLAEALNKEQSNSQL